MVEIYWIMIVPFTVFIIALELIKNGDKGANAIGIIKRAFLSVIILMSFDQCLNILAAVSDGISNKINGIYGLKQMLGYLETNYKNVSVSWLQFKEALIYVLNFSSYIIAYVGVFMANALIYFVWAILYVCAPLMILMFICEKTAYVTSNLFKGLINVAVWKIFYSILGVLLLKMATNPEVGNSENFLTSIIVNLCIAIAMLFTPFATKSLLGDGMSGFASGIAMAPSLMVAGMGKKFIQKQARNLKNGATNQMRNGFQAMKNKFAPERKKEIGEKGKEQTTTKTNQKDTKNEKRRKRSNKSVDRTKQDSKTVQDSGGRTDRDSPVSNNLHHDASKSSTSGSNSKQ